MDHYRVKPGDKIDLSEWNPDDHSHYSGSKEDAESEIQSACVQLGLLQQLLAAERKHKVLVILQAMDTGGKDGVVRRVFSETNPQGVRVVSFKVPTAPEADHDYLWRVHQQTPGKGELIVFNRSHYEDVLVVRVHNLVPKNIWSKRYDHINAFEKTLADEGTLILKFYLHISKAEQRQRLLDRLEDPAKNWKFAAGDLKERELWNDYMAAYEDLLNKTSTTYAPWYLIPANHKWYRDFLISKIICSELASLDMKYPQIVEDLSTYRAQLEKESGA